MGAGEVRLGMRRCPLEIWKYRVDHGSFRESSMTHCVEYIKIGRSVRGRQRCSILIDQEIETDLR